MHGMWGSVDEAYIARIAASYPGGRLGQPEDALSFAAFLCSDAESPSGTLLPIRPVPADQLSRSRPSHSLT
jgi:NAD(P)-dependent dehydrogenase (short-subunit alcohol dehydrogenase family)